MFRKFIKLYLAQYIIIATLDTNNSNKSCLSLTPCSDGRSAPQLLLWTLSDMCLVNNIKPCNITGVNNLMTDTTNLYTDKVFPTERTVCVNYSTNVAQVIEVCTYNLNLSTSPLQNAMLCKDSQMNGFYFDFKTKFNLIDQAVTSNSTLIPSSCKTVAISQSTALYPTPSPIPTIEPNQGTLSLMVL